MTRQVLAEPEPGLAAKTWARLADGILTKICIVLPSDIVYYMMIFFFII